MMFFTKKRKKGVAVIGGAGGGGGVEYLFRALFSTDDAAPIANPTVVEVGTIVPTDTADKLSISGGALNLLGKSTWGDPGFISGGSAFTRLAGRGTVFKVTPPASTLSHYYIQGHYAAQAADTNPAHGFALTSPSSFMIRLTSSELALLPTRNEFENGLGIVERVTAGAYFVSLDWGRLIWVTKTGSSNFYIGGTGYQAQTQKYNEIVCTDWGETWETDTALLAANVASPANGEVITQEADGLIEFTWTPAAAETLSIEFRKTDADNLWRLDCAQAGGTIKLWERVAGVETEYSTGKTQTWTAGTPYRIVIYMVASTIKTFVTNVLKNTTNAAYTQRSATGAKVSGFATGSTFQAWKSNVNSLIPSYLRQTVPACYMMFGDSKAAETGVPVTFGTLTGTRTAVAITTGGGTVVTRASTVVADLAAKDGIFDVRYVLCMLGINDVSAGTSQAAFEAAYLACVDEMQAKWPNVQVYLQKLWKPSGTAACAPYNTYIDNVIAARSSFVHAGADEFILENGDNGATYYADSVHPNAAGYAVLAQAFATAAGL